MRKTLTKYLLIVVSVLAIIFLLQKINWMPEWKNIFQSKPVEIENTPIIIREINSLSQLVSITYTDEVVMSETKSGSGLPSITSSGIGMILAPAIDRLVIIGRGKVIAGIDLSSITENDIRPQGDSIHVVLPHAQILNTIINPSGFEIFDEKGEWSAEQVAALELKIKREITNRALAQNILRQAEQSGSIVLEKFLNSTGFKKVTIEFRN